MNEKIIELSKKYKLYGWPLVAILLSIIIAFMVIFPQIFGYFKTQNEINDLLTRQKALEAKANQLASINTKDYQDNLVIVRTVLPENQDLPSAISQVQSLLAQSNLQLQDISFASGQSGGLAPGVTATNKNVVGLQNFQIKLDVTGDQKSFQAFLQNVKKAPQIMKVSGLEISTGKNNAVSASLTLLSYYEGPPGALGDVEQPLVGLTSSETQLLSTLQSEVEISPFAAPSSEVLPPRGKSNPFQ